MIAVLLAAGAMGLAGSLHCASMCGAASAALCRSRGQAMFHVLRTASYVAVGSVMGGAGHLLWTTVSPATTNLMRGLAALFVVAVGLDLVGWLPRPRFQNDAFAARLLRRFARVASKFQRGRAFVALGWGLLPCGLLYGALALAAMTDSALQGGATMLVFGLVTWPAMLVAARVLRYLRASATAPRLRVFSGVIIAALGCVMAAGPVGALQRVARGESLDGPVCCHGHDAPP